MTIAVSPSPQAIVDDDFEIKAPNVFPELALFVGTAVAHAPLLLDHFRNLWGRPHYQHFPVVLLAILYLIHDRWRYQRWATSRLLRPVGFALLMAAIGLLGFSSQMWSPTLGAVSFVVGAGASMMILRQKIRIRNAFGIWLLFWLIVPAPMGLDIRLSNYLQGATTFISGLLLDLFGVVNVVEGNTLMLTTGRLFVEEACSGIVSLMAVVACSLIIGVWNNRPVAHLGLLVVCGIAWAAFMNTMRIVVIGYCMVKMGTDLSTGWQHEAVGLVLFAITLLLTVSTDRFLGFLLHPVWSGPEQVSKQEKSRIVRAWNILFALGFPKQSPVSEMPHATPEYLRDNRLSHLLIPFAICFLIVGAYSGYCFASHGGTGIGIPQQMVDRANRMGSDSLPVEFEGWELTQFRSKRAEHGRIFGEFSRIWYYQKDERAAVFSLDFMFNDEWHELCSCYKSIGWVQLFRTVERSVAPPLVAADFHLNDKQFGRLQYSMVTDSGQAYDPPETQSFSSLVHRRLKKGTHRNLQIQLWATQSTKMTRRQKEELESLYVELRQRLIDSMFTGAGE